jgi:hypothetical protein
MFIALDTNNDGVIQVHELLHVIFSQATKEQLKLIAAYVDGELGRHSG